MNKEFATYEQSLALKQLGFDEPCFGIYFNLTKQLVQRIYDDTRPFDKEYFTLAPLKQQVFKWFREKHKLFPEIASYTEKYMDGKVKFNFEINVNFPFNYY